MLTWSIPYLVKKFTRFALSPKVVTKQRLRNTKIRLWSAREGVHRRVMGPTVSINGHGPRKYDPGVP